MPLAKRSFLLLIAFLFCQCCFAQTSALGLEKMQIAYVDMPNPIIVVVENAKCNSISVRTDNGTVTMDGCACVFRPARHGSAILTVYEDTKDGKQKRGAINVWVRTVPTPEFRLAGKTDGYISYSQLLACDGPILELSRFAYDIDQTIKSYIFQVTRGKDEKVLFERKFNSPNTRFDEDTKLALKNVVEGDELHIREAQFVNYKGDIQTINDIDLVVLMLHQN